jgi:hypothetical protein
MEDTTNTTSAVADPVAAVDTAAAVAAPADTSAAAPAADAPETADAAEGEGDEAADALDAALAQIHEWADDAEVTWEQFKAKASELFAELRAKL